MTAALIIAALIGAWIGSAITLAVMAMQDLAMKGDDTDVT